MLSTFSSLKNPREKLRGDFDSREICLQSMPFSEGLHPVADLRLRVRRRVLHLRGRVPGQGGKDGADTGGHVLRVITAFEHEDDFPGTDFIRLLDQFL